MRDLAPFAPAGACSSCPHRSTCHEPRKRIQDDQYSVGRHYECVFYRAIEEQHRRAQTASRGR
jgi:hypothetical protein